MEQFPVIFLRRNNWKLFHPCDLNYCNTIYLKQVPGFDLESTYKVVSFMWQNSNSTDLLIIHNG